MTQISGFTIIRNGLVYDYPFLESLRSLLPVVDELIINVGEGSDETAERLDSFSKAEGAGKIKLFSSHWPLDNPEKRRDGKILSEQTNLALDQCTGDWCIYLQADEVLHEDDTISLHQSIQKANSHPSVDGLLFNWIHLYGSYDIEQYSRSAYRREVRAFKKNCGARSIGDAQSFRKKNGSKLSVIQTPVRVFHYGWVRNPAAMKDKTFFMDSLYHQQTRSPETTATGDNYKYKKIPGLRRLQGTHPLVMKARILKKNWSWDLEHSPRIFKLADLKKGVLDFIEKLTGVRLFEYRSYRIVKL